MRITWVTRSFLDYRIPIYAEINRLCGNQLTVIYYKDVVPLRCQDKLKSILGERAMGLTGEFRIGGKKFENQAMANTGGLRIPLRPGLVKFVRRSKPDLLLSDGFFQWSYSALIINAIWNTPHLMCYERTSHTERNVSKFRIFVRKIASRYISAICCNGILTKEYLKQFGFSEDRLFIGNMVADTNGLQNTISKISNSDLNNLKNKYNLIGPVFLYVGQLIPRKGIMEMLTNWKIFNTKNPEPVLILLGAGSQLEEASIFIQTENIKKILILGAVEYSEVAKFYAIADIFLIPTLEDNWSLVVPEAMSCGLPIICSKYNGCWPELIKPENGWIFDPLDPNNFIEILESAWINRDKWKTMGMESLQIAKDYTPDKVAALIYNSCLSITKRK